MSNTLYIGSLKNGTRVVILGLENYYKSIEIIHSNDCGCSIKGYHKIDGTYKPLGANFTISNNTPVRIATVEDEKDLTEDIVKKDDEKKKAKLIKDLVELGVLTMPQTESVVVVEKKKEVEKSDDFIYPKGDFIVEDLAELNGTSKANAYIKMKKNDNVFKVGEKASKRGRPTIIYRVKYLDK